LTNQRPGLPFHLRAIRAALRRLNIYFSRRYESAAAREHPYPGPERTEELDRAIEELRRLDALDEPARAYFESHLPRLARTLTLTPRSQTSGRILELGCYMQITPFLESWSGYKEVRGAYAGPLGRTDQRSANVRGKSFEIPVDCFDVERDRFPYDDGYFETVLACELLEHLLCDPMHFLLECGRVLEEGGRLLITTPNACSLTSVARALHGYENPQVFSHYHRPWPHAPAEIPHVREYAAFELPAVLLSAGFEIEDLLTEPMPKFAMHLPMWNFLEEQGYNSSLRGEQTYCVAVKRSALPVTRYPAFLYSE
jgi:SAM-dependent methyltransferase